MSDVDVFIAELEEETRSIWTEEPFEITLIRNHVTLTGAGSEGQYFPVFVHLEAFMMLLGPHVIYRILLLSRDQEFGLYELRESMIGILTRPFDQFEFLGDLGLQSTHRFGRRYIELVGEADRVEFTRMTSSFLTYFNRVYQWIHLVFPWEFGEQMPKQVDAQSKMVENAMVSWRRENASH